MIRSQDLIRTLKRELRARGITYSKVAEHLGLSEASVKRVLAAEDLSLSRLDAICDLAGLDVGVLAELAAGAVDPLTELSAEQEQALVEDPRLLLVTYLALNQWPFAEMVRTFDVSEHQAVRLLARLDRLGMIDLLPGNRIRLKTARNFRWRRGGPVQRFFEQQVRGEFLDSPFDAEHERLYFVGGLLSQRSLAEVQRALERVAHEFDEAARADSALPLEQRDSCAAVLAVRRWEFSLFAGLRRKPAAKGA